MTDAQTGASFTFFIEHIERLARERPQAVVRAVALFPLVFVSFMILGKLFAPGKYAYLIREDNLVEQATCVVYLIAVAFAVASTVAFYRRAEKIYAVLYGLLSAGLFFVAMEEISWGQRIFGFEAPESLARLNQQNEANLHNIAGVHLHTVFVAVTAYGAFARMLVPGRFNDRRSILVDLLTAPRLTFLYFFVPFLLYSYYEGVRYYLSDGGQFIEYFSGSGVISGKDQEPIELLLSLGFLLFVVRIWHRYAKTS